MISATRLTRRKFLLEASGAGAAIAGTNLGMPADNVTAGNAGQITGLAFGSTMRRMQFALRF